MRFSKCLVQIREQPFKLIQTSVFKREACHLELGSRDRSRADCSPQTLDNFRVQYPEDALLGRSQKITTSDLNRKSYWYYQLFYHANSVNYRRNQSPGLTWVILDTEIC